MSTRSEFRDTARDGALEGSRSSVGVVAGSIIAATMIGSVVVLTAPFLGKQFLLGDLAYHRGVALSIDLAHPFGEGPIAGVMSYYGGLYHLALAALMAVPGVTFAAAVAAISLVWAVVWPVGLLFLGRRLWPGDWLTAAVFAAIATLAMPLSTRFTSDLWVESVLPSGMAAWPAYPRDIATTLGLVAIACFLGTGPRQRQLGTGVALAAAVAVHAQVAATSAALLFAWAAFTFARSRDRSRIVDCAAALGLAAILSAWWWLPRIEPTLAGPTLLADAPDRSPFRPTPLDAVINMSWIVFAAIAAIGWGIVRRRPPGGHPLVLLWIAVLVPLLALDRLAGGSAFAPERRTWLQLAIPLSAMAAWGLVAALRSIGRRAVSLVLAVALVGLSIPAGAATVSGLDEVWDDRRIAGRSWPADEWDAALEQLRRAARAGAVEVLTYDTEAPWIWSLTGARVFSLWLPGPIKLGWDPARETGLGYLERVRLADAAWSAGLPGVCGLATERGIEMLVMRSLEGLIATHDQTFAAPYRTSPSERDDVPPERAVGPGLTYVDSGPDWLVPDAGTAIRMPFTAEGVRTVVIEVRNIEREATVELTIDAGGQPIVASTVRGTGVQALRFDLPPGARGRALSVSASGEVMLLRALGHEAVELANPGTGAFVVSRADACSAETAGS